MFNSVTKCPTKRLLAGLLVGGILGSTAVGQVAPNWDAAGQMAGARLIPVASRHGRPPFAGTTAQGQKDSFFKAIWGVDQMEVRQLASGSMLQFRYRVLDPQRAGLLNDKKAEPHLIDAATGTKLSVPQAERIGNLRTTNTPTAGRVYWVMFEDPLHLVRHGSRVTVLIGGFRADGLTVE